MFQIFNIYLGLGVFRAMTSQTTTITVYACIELSQSTRNGLCMIVTWQQKLQVYGQALSRSPIKLLMFQDLYT